MEEKVIRVTAFDGDASVVRKNTGLAHDENVTRIFGLDLGTTNSAISIVTEGITPTAIKLETGRYTMPSCVMWEGGRFVIGDRAYKLRAQPNVIYSVKRLMQTPGAQVHLVDGNDSITLSPAEVSAEILKGLIRLTGGVYGEVKDVIVTVPAYFNQIGKDNTRRACEIAGLNLIALENEPSAAVLQYDFKTESNGTEDIVVYDFGGGTFDVTLARISDNSGMSEMASMFGMDYDGDGGGKTIEPLSISGDPRLGGDDVDYALFKILCGKLGIRSESVPAMYRKQCLLRLEQMKKSGTVGLQYSFSFNTELMTGEKVEEDVMIGMDDFIEALRPSYLKTKQITDSVLASVQNNVKKIVLVGGSTKSQLLQAMLKNDYPDLEINTAFDPDLSVTRGAAIKGKILKYGDTNIHVFDILPIAIGIVEDGLVVPVIEKNTSLPVVKSLNFTTTSDYQKEVAVKLYQGNSSYVEECVSLGSIIIDGIKEKKAGKPVLSVKLSITADSLMTCEAVIDGVKKEIKLNLSGDHAAEQRELSRDEKQVIRWRARAKEIGGEAGRVLDGMLDQYPESVTREQIIAYIKEHCKMVRAE